MVKAEGSAWKDHGGMNMKAYAFDAEKARDNLVDGLRNLAREQGFSRVALGISGGKDSTVTAAICARALGRENVFGVMMPDGVQADLSDSVEKTGIMVSIRQIL